MDREILLWSQGFGLADIETSRPARESTVYHLFSGTKIFTAAAVLRLVENGALDLDAETTSYLPDLPQLDGIKLRELLGHSSGLKDTLRGFMAVYFPGEDPPTTAQALKGYKLQSGGGPGGKAQYRNVNYAILGELVSRVSGLAYPDYVRQHILAPLASEADFEAVGKRTEEMATGYIGRWDPTRLMLRLVMPTVSRRLYREQTKGLVALNDYNLATQAIGGLVDKI